MNYQSTNKIKYLHLGHNEEPANGWINLDDVQTKDISYNFNLGVPFADNSFDIIYISNVLERLDEYHRRYLLDECFRALKPSATIRLSLKDLSKLTQNYLQSINELNQSGNSDSHTKALEDLLGKSGEITEPITALPIPDPQYISGGEKILYLYDFYTIKELLKNIGFIDIIQKEYNSSSSPDFLKNNLDCDSTGNAKEINNFYIEASKPNQAATDAIKVAVFNTYSYGGAANAALRQHIAMRKAGINSVCYTANQRQSTKNCIYPVPSRDNTLKSINNSAVITDGFEREWKTWFNEVFQYKNRQDKDDYCEKYSDSLNPNNIPNFEDFDVINLEWVIGFANPIIHPEYYQGKKIVWTLHDMNPFTGGCHYNWECDKFKTGCKNCPLLCSGSDNDLSAKIFNKKLESYSKLDIHVVAPSEWMAKEARESKLFSQFPVSVIRYAQPLDTFTTLNKDSLRSQLGINTSDIVLLFTADTVSAPRKGFIYIYQMLQELAKTALAPRIVLYVMGNQIPEEIFKLGLRVQSLGYISSEDHAAIFYNVADALIVPSLYDNSPNTICESLGCGTPVIGFNSGGIPEMIVHKKTGFIAEKGNSYSLLQGVEWLSTVHGDINTRIACRKFAEENYGEITQAKKYEDLYHKLCTKDNNQPSELKETTNIQNNITISNTTNNNVKHVAVDGRCFLYKTITTRGIGHYSSNLLHTIAKLHPEIKITFYYEANTDITEFRKLFPEQNIDFSFYGPEPKLDADLFFIPDPMSLNPGFRSPFTITRNMKISSIFYDIIPLTYDKYLKTWNENLQNEYMARLGQIRVLKPQILAISESTKNDLAREINYNQNIMEVIYAGLNESHLLQDHTTSEIDSTLQKFNIQKPFFLTVGSCDHHKNFDFSVSSLISLLADYYGKKFEYMPYLVVVGDEKDPYKMFYKEFFHSKGINNVIFTGYLPQKELGCLYASASALLFPSACEGFGFPILEAMANKCAVITANNTSLPEVAGDAGVYVEIGDIDGMKAAMRKLICDDAYRQNLINIGYERSKLFSWEKTAEATVQAWNKLIL